MKLKKAIAFCLAAQMLAMSFAACSNNTSDETEAAGAKSPIETSAPATSAPATSAPETAAPETEPVETKLDRTTVSDNLPDMSFGGQDYRILSISNYVWEIMSEDYNGDQVNDQIFDRNKRIEDRFDVKISAHTADEYGWNIENAICDLVLADDYAYEVCSLRLQQSLAAPGNYLAFYNCLKIPYIGWEQPWWYKQSNDNATFDGKLWTLNGSMNLTTVNTSWIMLCNRDLLQEFNYTPDQINQIVFDGEWTLDKMIEICSDIYRDDNGDSLRNLGDTFGFGFNPAVYTIPWVNAFGETSVVPSEDRTELKINLNSEKLYSALEKLVNFQWNAPGSYMCETPQNNEISYEYYEGYKNGQIVFVPSNFSAFQTYSSLGFENGLVPLPKYDTAQDSYYTNPEAECTTLAVACNVPQEYLDMIGIVLEALNAETWKYVYPVFYDDMLKGRYSVDADTAAMVDLIMDGCYHDFSWQVGIWMGSHPPALFNNCISEGSTDLASKLASVQSRYDEGLPFIRSFFHDDYELPVWD